MKKRRGKGKSKKGKTLSPQSDANEAARNDENFAKEDADDNNNKLVRNGKFALDFSADHYSLYERTSGSEELRAKGEKDVDVHVRSKRVKADPERPTKGQLVLPPLKESKSGKRLTLVGGNRVGRHLLNGSLDDKVNLHKAVDFTSSENRLSKRLASVSFVGVYDLEDMRGEDKHAEEEKTKLNNCVLKLNNCEGEFMQHVGIKSEETSVVETKHDDENNSEKATCYVENGAGKSAYAVKNLTFEGDCPPSDGIVEHEKVTFPGIKKGRALENSHKTMMPHEEGMTQDKFFSEIENAERESRVKNRLPKIDGAFSKRTRSYRRKRRQHNIFYEPVQFDKNILRLPVVVNGKLTIT